MSYSSEQSKSRITASAQQEFLACGFEKANLRRIAQNAHVTTGALYNYYSGKAALFDALVADTAAELFDQFCSRHDTIAAALAQSGRLRGDSLVDDGVGWLVDYIYGHYPPVKLLLCWHKMGKLSGAFYCAGGTRLQAVFSDACAGVRTAQRLVFSLYRCRRFSVCSTLDGA